MNDVFNYTDVMMKLKNRTDISDFIGKYTLFPDYLQNPDFLNTLLWPQYRVLLFFYRLTLGKQRLSGEYQSGDIKRETGLEHKHFIPALNGLKALNLVTDGKQSDSKNDHMFHVCDFGGMPKTWQVTFLFPLSRRDYGKYKQSKFHPITKFWYIGDGKNHKEQCYVETGTGDVYPTLRSVIVNPCYYDNQKPSIIVLTDFTTKRVFDCKLGEALFIPATKQGDSPCELWIQNPMINEKNHLYMFTWFPLAELPPLAPFDITALNSFPKFGKIQGRESR